METQKKKRFELSNIKETIQNDGLKSTIVQFIKFGLVGVSNTLISLGTYYLCVYVLHLHYQLANLIGFIISVTNAYFWNSRYVFKMGEHRSFSDHLKTYGKTVTAYGATYLLSTALLWLWVDKLGISEAVAPIINLLITIPLNFLINKFWTFRKASATPDGASAKEEADTQK